MMFIMFINCVALRFPLKLKFFYYIIYVYIVISNIIKFVYNNK